MTEPLSKVDSAVEGVDAGKDAKDTKKPRMSSIAAPGVWNIKDIGTFCPARSLEGSNCLDIS